MFTLFDALCAGTVKMSKQSNEVMAAAKDNGRETTPRRGSGNRPNRDEFYKAKEHAEEVLGLDEKVSDGLRRAMARFKNSPLTLYMEVLNDPEQPWERRLDAAERAKPFLHRKLEDQHGTNGNNGGNNGVPATVGSRGPTINLTVNRPSVTVNQRDAEVEIQGKPATDKKDEPQQKASTAQPKAFKKPKKAAK